MGDALMMLAADLARKEFGPVKQLPQDALIEAVVGADQSSSDSSCTDCGTPTPKERGWFVPFGTHVLCRTCRNHRLETSTNTAARRAAGEAQ